MIEPLSRRLQWMAVVGNHEIETDYVHNETFRAFKSRFAMPEDEPEIDKTTYEMLPCFKGIDPATGLCPVANYWCTPSYWVGAYDYGQSFYSYEMGPVTMVALNTYTQTDANSNQYVS
jgi:hypothetical protein